MPSRFSVVALAATIEAAEEASMRLKDEPRLASEPPTAASARADARCRSLERQERAAWLEAAIHRLQADGYPDEGEALRLGILARHTADFRLIALHAAS